MVCDVRGCEIINCVVSFSIQLLVIKMVLKCSVMICLVFASHFVQKKLLEGCLTHQRVGVLESKMSVSATATQFGVSRQTESL